MRLIEMKTKIKNITKQLINNMKNFTYVNIYIEGEDVNFQSLAIPFYGFSFHNTSCVIHERELFNKTNNGMILHFMHIPNSIDDIEFFKKNDEYFLIIKSQNSNMLGDFWGIIRENLLSHNILDEMLGKNNWTRDY